MTRALLVGREPGMDLGFSYVREPPYEVVMIGSLSLSQLLRFSEEPVLEAIAQGKQVYLYTPGLPQSPKSRPLAAGLASAQRELKNWGVLFTDGAQRRLITAQEAENMKLRGQHPGPGAMLTPLAKEILEGSD